MEEEKEITLQSGRKVKIVTWPMRPSLRHANLVREVAQNIASALGLLELTEDDIAKIDTLSVQGMLDAANEVLRSDPDRLFEFICHGCTLKPEEIDKLRFDETLELAFHIGDFNLRPTSGLFGLFKKLRGKSTKPLRS